MGLHDGRLSTSGEGLLLWDRRLHCNIGHFVGVLEFWLAGSGRRLKLKATTTVSQEFDVLLYLEDLSLSCSEVRRWRAGTDQASEPGVNATGR